MEISPRTALAFEAGEGPRRSQVEFALHVKRNERCAKEGVIRGATMPHPDPAMKVHGLAAWSIHLHVLAQFLAEKMSMIRRQDNSLKTQSKEHSNSAPKVIQDAVHLPPGLSDVVLLAEFVDLLRGHENQLCIRDSLPNFFRWFRQEIVQLGVEDFDTCMFL